MAERFTSSAGLTAGLIPLADLESDTARLAHRVRELLDDGCQALLTDAAC